MVRIPGDRGPSVKNRSSKHRLLLRDMPKPSRKLKNNEKNNSTKTNKKEGNS